MNLLFFAGGSHVGGMEVVLQGLMAQLNAIGHRTLAIVSSWNNGDYPARLRACSLPFEELKLGRFYKTRPLWTLDGIRHLPAAAYRLRHLAQHFRADAVIYPDLQLFLIGSLILPGRPAIFYEHNDPRVHNTPRMLRAVSKRARHVVCVSEFIAAGALSVGFDSRKISVVHNGIPFPPVVHPPSRHEPVRLGIVGQLLPRKQHLALVEALATVRSRCPSLSFCLKIVGSDNTPYAQEVRAAIEKANMGDVVEWVGFLAGRDEIYCQLDALVAPALNEPFGMTILEAGIYGLPVIAARSGGFPELVIDGTTGLLFDPGDPKALGATLEKLLGDPELHRRLGRAGRAHVQSKFGIERMAIRFAETVSQSGPD